ncbi:hypothetical protein PV10_04431 [Exophiala mesophila]|uniref:RED-like N-terminal domain-containing protein n=1 Tax=Exophiala mesophila TaxID=212818 RepID=A0A0D1ZHA4_EXOME|nr:uncharacterized protein PV10_04431 [Exophiala mesophila]KIV93194.1 hypothetical protein PV10_04431 [Exophiala mesophila]
MDNSQFRSLLNSGQKSQASPDGSNASGFKKPALGSRARSSIPMTPRVLAGFNAAKDFSRQVAEHQRSADGQPPVKKFRSSAAPKGTKLGSGYQDRTLARKNDDGSEESQDDKEKRFKALEEMFKLQQIDQVTFDRLKAELGIGGTLESTHMVKGLDWKLLERARKGEDLNQAPSTEKDTKSEAPEVDIEDELDQALAKEIDVTKPAQNTADDHDDSEAITGAQPTTRDEILRRLKESRGARRDTPSEPAPALGGKFKKLVSEKKSNKKKFVESINGRRREVLVITNKDGTTKRKTRWLDDEAARGEANDGRPLGMEIPAEILARQKAMEAEEAAAEDDNDDIFGGVAEYDPLAGINDDSDESEALVEKSETTKPESSTDTGQSRNYFGQITQRDEGADDRANPIMKDPTLLAALKRAAGLRRQDEAGMDGDESAEPDNVDQEAKHKKFLARLKEQDRADAADLDLGFGESRFGDEDEEDGAIWEGDEGGEQTKKSGRKRGSKKRKGDKDSVADVMRVLEGRNKDK